MHLMRLSLGMLKTHPEIVAILEWVSTELGKRSRSCPRTVVTCSNSIKWEWPGSQVVNAQSFRAEDSLGLVLRQHGYASLLILSSEEQPTQTDTQNDYCTCNHRACAPRLNKCGSSWACDNTCTVESRDYAPPLCAC